MPPVLGRAAGAFVRALPVLCVPRRAVSVAWPPVHGELAGDVHSDLEGRQERVDVMQLAEFWLQGSGCEPFLLVKKTRDVNMRYDTWHNPDTNYMPLILWACHVLSLPLSCSPGTQLVSGGGWFGLEAALWLCLTGPLCSGRSSGRLGKRNSLFIAKWWDQNFQVFYDRFTKWESQWPWPLKFQVWVLVEDGKECWNSCRGRHGGGASLGEVPQGVGQAGRGTCGITPSIWDRAPGAEREGCPGSSEHQLWDWECSWNRWGSHREELGQASWEMSETEALPKAEQQEKVKQSRSKAALQRCKGVLWRTAGASKRLCGDTALALDSDVVVRYSCHWCPLLLLDCLNIF